MKAEYYPEVDMLTIDFVEGVSTESAEVSEGFVFNYDDNGKVVGMEIDNASRRVRLDDEIGLDIKVMGDIYTVSMAAKELGVGKRAVAKTIQAMREGGLTVGKQETPTGAIILTATDLKAIKRWREDHPRGRPANKATA